MTVWIRPLSSRYVVTFVDDDSARVTARVVAPRASLMVVRVEVPTDLVRTVVPFGKRVRVGSSEYAAVAVKSKNKRN